MGKATKYKTATGHPIPPICPYCGSAAVFNASSADYYSGRDFGPLWACDPCEAWVGCHKGKNIALGRLANKELRIWKKRAHDAFDPLWREKLRRRREERGPEYKVFYARGSGYKWLALQLGIDRSACHIGEFDVDQCKRVVEICRPYLERIAS